MSKIVDGDIESNPGPTYTITKTVQGSFHQGDIKFGDTAGKQCACITLFSILWSKIRRVGLWNSGDLDQILCQGDKLYKQLGTNDFLTVDDLPQSINIENNNLIVTKLSYEEGKMCSRSRNIFNSSSNSDGFLLFIDNYTLAVIWNKAHVFLLDSHSRDKDGKITDEGLSVLLQFRSFNALDKYIYEVYVMEKHFQKIYFTVQHIGININTECAEYVSTSFKKRKYVNSQHEQRKKQNRDQYSSIFGTPEHEQRKKQMQDYSVNKYSSIFGTQEHEERKKQKRDQYSSIFGTPEHEERKKQMRDFSTQVYYKEKGINVLNKLWIK